MAFTRRHGNTYSICDRITDAVTGRRKEITVCCLACYPTLSEALERMPLDVAKCRKSLAAAKADLALFPHRREIRQEVNRLSDLLAKWTDQLKRVKAYAKTLAQGAAS